MIIASGLLTPVAVGLLIAALVTSSLPMMIGAVAASVAAGALLIGAVRQRRTDFVAPTEQVVVPTVDVPFPPMAPGLEPAAPVAADVRPPDPELGAQALQPRQSPPPEGDVPRPQ